MRIEEQLGCGTTHTLNAAGNEDQGVLVGCKECLQAEGQKCDCPGSPPVEATLLKEKTLFPVAETSTGGIS